MSKKRELFLSFLFLYRNNRSSEYTARVAFGRKQRSDIKILLSLDRLIPYKHIGGDKKHCLMSFKTF